MLQFLYVLYQVVLVFPLLWIAQRLWVKITPYDDYELMISNKMSSSVLVYLGYIVAIIFIMALSFHGESVNWFTDTLFIVSVFVVANLALLLEAYLLSYIFGGFNKIFQKVKEGNFAIAIYQAFLFVSIGLQILVTNFDKTLSFEYFCITVPYFVLGQFFILISVFLFQKITSYDDLSEMMKGNIAVAISYAGLFISVTLLISNVLRNVLVFDFSTLGLVVVYSIFSLIFILFIPGLLSKFILLPVLKESNSKNLDAMIADGNINVALIDATVKIILSVVVFFSMSFYIV